jgi:uncharacterized protein YjaZ
MKVNVLVANANNNLLQFLPKIESATKLAEDYVGRKLALQYDVNIVFAELDQFIIPEDGMGGRTYRDDFILITLNAEKNFSEDTLFEIICHELCHAARWGVNPEYMMTLFDGAINEGIATNFEEMAVRDNNIRNKQVFLRTVANRSDADNEMILSLLRSQLDNNQYDYDEIFFNGSSQLPRWAGYSLGYYLVKKYLSASGKSIDQAFADKFLDYKTVLN